MKKSLKLYRRISETIALTFVFLLLSATVSAQTVVSGKVTDSKDGSGLAGVTVTAKGTKVSTQTAADGTYKISLPSGATTLVFTSVGFAKQELPAGSGNVNVSFVTTNQQLNEVVVVAYGTRKKGDLTGAVTSVTAKDFQKGNIASSEQLLVGKVAGLQVTTGGGSAGGGSTIRIRGGASLAASNDPLIVIDGVPVESNGISGNGNILNTINPNDIESISVLKDASATVLYGSRASNGVVIVTTKKGSRGRLRFNFNSQYSSSRVVKKVDVFTADEVRKIITDDAAATNNNSYKDLLGTANTDWQSLIYQNANGYNNNFSVSGAIGDGALPFRLSIGHLSQEGILRTDKFKRITGGLNLSPKLFDNHLSVNLNLKLAQTKNRFADGGAVGSAASFDPTQPVMVDDTKYGKYFEWGNIDLATRNPVALLNQRNNNSVVNRTIANVQLDYKLHFLPDLHVQANFGLDNANGNGDDLIDSLSVTNYKTKGRATHYAQYKSNYVADLSLFYEKTIGKNKVDVLVGHTYQDFLTNIFNYASYGRDGKVIEDSKPRFATDKYQYRLEAYIGRINYSFNDKYLLTANIRRDATSKLSPENRVNYLAGAAIAWRLNNEFFKNSNVVNDLKLRLSYGQTGQQDGIDAYYYQQRYSLSEPTAQYQFGNFYEPFLRANAYNSDLKWERTDAYNIGLDFGFLNNRISGSIDAYSRKTKDLISAVTISPGTNFDITQLSNVGNVESKGIEVVLNLVPVKTKDFTWELGVNATYYKTKITNLLNPNPNFKGYNVNGISGGTGNTIGKFAVDFAPYAFNVYKQVYDKTSGLPIEGLVEDINRDGRISEEDKYLYKKPAPDVFFGVSTQFIYKKWSVGFAGHGSLGNYMYNNYASGAGVLNSLKNPLVFTGNGSVSYYDTKFKNNQYFSDFYVQNASYFRLDNINVGFNAGRIMNKATLRVSGSVQNVFVITDYKGFDPENSSGVDNNIYPRPRIYSLGINLDF